tara:strand:+ start:71 stop:436 length:366 start_codon:yes stop_codon:yes gene_type:complete
VKRFDKNTKQSYNLNMGKVLQFPGKNKRVEDLTDMFEQDQITKLTLTDRQTIDATELMIEYAFEQGGDIEPLVRSKELADLVKHLHIFFGRLNGVKSHDLDHERKLDMSYLYNKDGLFEDN